MTRISVAIPPRLVEGLWRALTASRHALVEEVEHATDAMARGEPAGDRLRQARVELAEVADLIEQLTAGRGRRVLTGEREPLRAASCDALVGAIERLTAAATRYWRTGMGLGSLEPELAAVSEHVGMLRALERAPPQGG